MFRLLLLIIPMGYVNRLELVYIDMFFWNGMGVSWFFCRFGLKS
jgi:hypothetical protein